MKKILANIVTTSNKINFVLPVNKCKDMSCVDNDLPTLIIGYELAKKYIDNFNILVKYYPKQNVYWTFKRTERGIEYESDILSFYKTVITSFCERIKYNLIDFYKINLRTSIKLVGFAKSKDKKLIYNENNRFLYIFCEKYNMVFGFSLSTSNFFGISPQKIISLFKNNDSNTFISDFTVIPNDIKYIIGEKIDKYLPLYEYFTEE